MMRRTPIATASLLVCLSILCGCASSNRVVKIFEDTGFSGGPFANILVVGAHKNANTRRRFESTVANAIRPSGSAASPSLNFMRSTDEINRESLLAIVERENFDAVLITRLVDMQTRVEDREGSSTVVAQRRNDIPLADFFRYDYVEYQDPMETTTVRTVVLATDLYYVATESKIWSVESTGIEKTTAYDAIVDMARALASAMSRDELIR